MHTLSRCLRGRTHPLAATLREGRSGRLTFKQFRHESLGVASYLLGSAERGEALIVDPAVHFGVNFGVLEAAELGLKVSGVLETRVHADMVSCARPQPAVRHAAPPERRGHGAVLVHAPARRRGAAHARPHTRARVLSGGGPRSVDKSLVPAQRRCAAGGGRGSARSVLRGRGARPREADRACRPAVPSPPRAVVSPTRIRTHYGRGLAASDKPSSTTGFEKRCNPAFRARDALAFARYIRETTRLLPIAHRRIKAMNMGLEGDAARVSSTGGPCGQ